MTERTQANHIQFALGVFLALQGVNMMAMVKMLIGRNLRILTPAVMLLTLLMLIDWSRLRRLLFVRLNIKKRGVVVYLGTVTVLSFFSGYDLTQPAYGFAYQLIYLLTILALWNHTEVIEGESFLRMFFYLSGMLCILAMILILKNARQTGDLFFQGLGREADGNVIITRASTGSIALLLFASVLSYRPRNNWEKLVRLVFLLVSFFVLFVSRRRSTYVFFLLMLVYWLAQKGIGTYRIKRGTAIRVIASFMFLAAVFLFLMSYSGTREVMERGIHSLVKGVSTYIGKTEDDAAALYRYERLVRIPKMIIVESSLWQLLFGYGYMQEWLDIPVLQAFYDIGLIGGIVYL